ncbi:MAG TPA: hypothetical protein EYP62_08440 [Kiritimatiellae bacterium]|nr:hypothetical protein [Kiritimatiellia bacterium]
MRVPATVAWVLCLVTAGVVTGQDYSNTSSVVDGMGRSSAGGGYTNLSAGAQPSAITEVHAGSMGNQQGFLNTFFFRSDLDTDADGLPDEADPDNDDDTLIDQVEIEGGAFDPVTPTDLNNYDTDGDGISDGGEAVAATDPSDPAAYLHIVDIYRTASNVHIFYLARGGTVSGKVYHVRAAGSGEDMPGEIVATNVTPAGGTAPWYVVTNEHIDTLADSNLFYGVEALQ